MAIENILGHDINVIRMEPNPDHIKRVIEKRLRYAEKLAKVEPGSMIQIDDSGYEAICEISRSSAGLALEVFKLVLENTPEEERKLPYTVTGEDVRALGFTYESLCEWWDNPLRGCAVVHMKKPWYEE